jgi:hypothetical protein
MAFPKTIGGAADRLYKLREERLELSKKVDALKAKESDLHTHIIALMNKARITSGRGKLATVSISPKTVPSVVNWSKVYGYIKKNNAFDLLQRRMGVEAWRDRREAGETIPGIEAVDINSVSCTKASK